MKKNTILLLAGVCTLMTGCGGTKYTQETPLLPDVKSSEVLTLKEDSFKLIREISVQIDTFLEGSYDGYVKFAYSGAVEKTDVENTYKLTVEKWVISGFKSEGEDADFDAGDLVMTGFLSLLLDQATVTNVKDGKKVIIENTEILAPSVIVVNEEEKTFSGIVG